RLASLMKIQAIYVFRHDSVFLGEDGPTHQPVEQVWGLRTVPGLDVVRPADGVETAYAWAHALKRRDAPTALSLTRHNIPALERPADFQLSSLEDGGYVVRDVKDPELVLIATGSEVSVALEAVAILEKEGRRIRVVSMPCLEAFLRLPAEKQDAVLLKGVRRASFELGITTPWKALTGLDGINIGIDHFGASAPYEVLADQFGVTAEKVAARISQELA
ncbi:MAG: transketolase, partial [Polyangiaceae bacterium]|nr:transketolase [Polyangiaceae bacterium]